MTPKQRAKHMKKLRKQIAATQAKVRQPQKNLRDAKALGDRLIWLSDALKELREEKGEDGDG